MRLTLAPMTPDHVLALTPQHKQADMPADARVDTALALSSQGGAWAVLDGGEVLAIAGVAEQWPGRGLAWCLLSKDAGRRMVGITRMVGRYLGALDYRRIEMYVDAQFCEGCRWAELLGFKNETPEGMDGFFPNGNRAFMYGRTR